MRRLTLIALLVAVVVIPACGCGPALLQPQPEATATETAIVVRAERDAYADALAAVRVLVPSLQGPNRVDTLRTAYAMLVTMYGGENVMANHEWLALVADEYGYAAAVGVYAHELGHMPQVGDAMGVDSNTQQGADAVAGCALAILGLPVDGYTQLMKDLMGDKSLPRVMAAEYAHTNCDQGMPRFGP